MKRVAAIVEGYGDVTAVPVLLARLGALFSEAIIANNPIRAGEWKSIIAKDALPKFLELAHSRQTDLILVALDLDDHCPVEEYKKASEIIDTWRNGRVIPVEVVFFNREYETMFLHCPEDITDNVISARHLNPELLRDAKGAVKEIIGRRYKETQDQVAFSKKIDLHKLYDRSRAFRKLCKSIIGMDYESLAVLM